MDEWQVRAEATFQAIRQEVNANLRHLQEILYRRGDEARKMIRVEVTHAVESDLLCNVEQLYRTRNNIVGSDGPMVFEGVSYYVVRSLPEPGWRVINPLRGR